MVTQVDQTRLILDLLQNLCFSVHHVLVLEDLFDGHYFACYSILSLNSSHECCEEDKFAYLENFAEGTASQDLDEVELIESALRLVRLGRQDDLGPRRALLHSHDFLLLLSLDSLRQFPLLEVEVAGIDRAEVVQAESLLLDLLSALFFH